MNGTTEIVQAVSTFFAAIIGALFTLLVHRGGKRSETSRERLDKVYAPAFILVEEFLYKNIPAKQCVQFLDELDTIAAKGGVLSDPALKDLISKCRLRTDDNCFNYKLFKYKFFSQGPSYLAYWFDICSHIDKTYDILCKRSFLPIRSVRYRLQNNQYINRLVWLLNFFRIEWPNLLFFFVLIALILLQMLPIK